MTSTKMLHEPCYDYMEKPTSILLSRRSFLKAIGVVVAAVAMSGYTLTNLILKRNTYIRQRQEGLYKDDLRLQKMGLTSCHNNPTLIQCYKDMNGKPVEGVMEELLHTSYVERLNFGLTKVSHD